MDCNSISSAPPRIMAEWKIVPDSQILQSQDRTVPLQANGGSFTNRDCTGAM